VGMATHWTKVSGGLSERPKNWAQLGQQFGRYKKEMTQCMPTDNLQRRKY